MKNRLLYTVLLFAILALSSVGPLVAQTANDGKLAKVIGSGSNLRWEVLVQNAGLGLTISAPDGRSFHKDFRAGASPDFSIADRQFPDGVYSYELRLNPVLTAAQREAIRAARGQDDDPEAERAGRRRPVVPLMVQDGSFAIVNGQVIVAGALTEFNRTGKNSVQPSEPRAATTGNTIRRLRNHRFALGMMPDDVIADDLIVQGSECLGLDCVNGETFNFDTLRLKENNTRIAFHDTSTNVGFPTNDWIIRANSSESGGESFLAFVDSGDDETGDNVGTIVFRVDAGAPGNSLRVSSSGKIGIRNSTPSLDLHIKSTDTPAQRLEQTAGGGFTAQTWDIGGNETNFFVRDVTGGSRIPFRIRPGAPTSSVDVSANGNVGIGTAGAGAKLTVFNSAASLQELLRLDNPDASGAGAKISFDQNGTELGRIAGYYGGGSLWNLGLGSQGTLETMTLRGGNVGIGTTSPDQKLSVNGDADKTGGNTWLAFSDERLKNIKGNFNSGLKAVMQLQPIRYEYKQDNALGLKSNGEHIGFGAQAVQKIIPEAVTKNSDGYLMVNGDPIMWTMLNAIKEQQKEIEQLKGQIKELQRPSRRHRR